MAQTISVSEKTAYRAIKKLQNENIIKRPESLQKLEWSVIDDQ